MEPKVHADIFSGDPRRQQIDEWIQEARNLARSEPGEALTLAWDAHKFARELGYVRGEAESLLAQTVCHCLMGTFAEAAIALDRVDEINLVLSDKRLEASRENIRCFFHYNRGEQGLALDAAYRSVALWRELNDPRELVKPLSNLASQLINTGRSQEAVAYLTEALALTAEYPNPSARSVVLSNIGIVHLRNRDREKAQPFLEEAVELMERQREYQNAILNLYHLTESNLELGYIEKGEFAAEQAVRLAKEFGQPQSEVLALRTQAIVFAKREEWDRTLSILRRALRLAQKRGITYDAAGLLVQTADCLWAMGRHRAARRALQEAVRYATAVADRVTLVEAYQRLADVCASLRDFAGAYENFRAYHELSCEHEKEEERQRHAVEASLWEMDRIRLESDLASREAELARLTDKIN